MLTHSLVPSVGTIAVQGCLASSEKEEESSTNPGGARGRANPAQTAEEGAEAEAEAETGAEAGARY